MSKQYPGGIISKTPVTPSGPYSNDTASGIWTLDQQAYWAKLGQWPTAGNNPIDPQFNYVTMLLHGDGTNGAQNNTFLDSSTNNFTITRNGNTTQGSFSPYGSNWSNYFDGSGDYLLFADNAGLEIGTNSFTFEAWIYLTAYSSAYGSPAEYVATVGAKEGTNGSVSYRLVVVGTASSYTSLNWQTYSNDSTNVTTSASYAFALNTWYHVAAVRNGTTVTLYVNGTSIGSNTDATNSQNTSAPFRVGSIGYTNYEYYFPGYISNLRLVNGTAVYTSNFTPPTAPLTAITNTGILTCQSNRFIDNSTNNATVTVYGNSSVQRFNPFGASSAYSTSVIGGSGYFDGSGDTLTTSTSQIIPTGSFTVECWAYVTGTGANQKFVAQGSSGAAGRFSLGIEGGNWWVQLGGDAIQTGTPVKNQWNYVAVTYNGSTITLYVNGTSIGTVSSTANAQNTTLTIGQDWNSYIVTGYVADVRISNTVRTITTPTAPYSSDGSTRLLLSMTNGAIFDNAMMNDLETVGNAQISTSVVKYGTGSLKFDGTGDYLNTRYSPNTQLGAGNFTIEFWIYFNSVASGQEPMSGYDNTNLNWGFYLLSSGTLNYYLSSDGSSWNIASGVSVGSVSTGQWYHVALVRNGSTFTPYLNGVAGTTATSSSAIYSNSQGVYIGGLPSGYEFNGYFDDIRITKGYARYTANFTPPTAAFFNYGPT